MSMFNKPTIKEIYNTIINDYKTRTSVQVPILKRALIKCFAYAIAGVVSFIWNFAEWQYLQIFIETCDFEALVRWGNLVNVNFKTGTKTILQIQLDNVSKSEITAGTSWKSLKNGLIYKSLSSIQVDVNNYQLSIVNYQFLNVECTEYGSNGNLLNDEELIITNSILGIPDKAIVKNTITTGSDSENIEDYRIRVLNRYKRKPQGGSAVDYYNWVTEVAGISDCFPYVLEAGLITLYVVANGSGINRTPTGSIEPNTFPQWQNGQMIDVVGYGQFLSVANSINGDNTNGSSNNRRPLNTKIKLLPPNYTEYKIEITELNPINETLINKIKENLTTELNKKRPNVKAVGYTINDATINSNQLNSIVQNIMNSVNGSFTSFTLRNKDNQIILNDVLSIGCLAYLSELSINNLNINV